MKQTPRILLKLQKWCRNYSFLLARLSVHWAEITEWVECESWPFYVYTLALIQNSSRSLSRSNHFPNWLLITSLNFRCWAESNRVTIDAAGNKRINLIHVVKVIDMIFNFGLAQPEARTKLLQYHISDLVSFECRMCSMPMWTVMFRIPCDYHSMPCIAYDTICNCEVWCEASIKLWMATFGIVIKFFVSRFGIVERMLQMVRRTNGWTS